MSLSKIVNRQLLDAVGLRVSPVASNAAAEFDRAVTKVLSELSDLRECELSVSSLQGMEAKTREELSQALKDESWRSEFRGRDVLRRFAGSHVEGMRYEYFRDLIIAEMREAGHQPPGMKAVLERILENAEKVDARC